jgi:hypothetical protein
MLLQRGRRCEETQDEKYRSHNLRVSKRVSEGTILVEEAELGGDGKLTQDEGGEMKQEEEKERIREEKSK